MNKLPASILGSSYPDVEFEEDEWFVADDEEQISWSESFGRPVRDEYSLSMPEYRGRPARRSRFSANFADSGLGDTGEGLAIMDFGDTDSMLGASLFDEGSLSGVQNRLDDVNRHFRRKAASVLNDDAALHLLAEMYSKKVVETPEFDFCRDGRSLAKLTAAHFCEVGANGIYVTERGYRFFNFLKTK